MMRPFIIVLLSALLPLCLPAMPQQLEGTRAPVKGRVVIAVDVQNGTHKTGIASANVRIISGKDTLKTATDNMGLFRLDNVPVGKVKIVATHLNMRPSILETEVFPGENIFELELEMKDYEWLGAAKVVARSDAVTVKGDTLIFHASAVSTMDGDRLVDILNQMPGVEIRDSGVYVDGKPVKRTYINGKLIFGDSPMSALGHLMAADVSTIEAYDETSIEDRRKGILVGEKEKVLNVKTKKPLYSAWDAHAIVSGGTDGAADDSGNVQPRYGAGITANLFSEDFLTYVNLNANNINRNSNNVRDILNVSPLRNYSETLLADAGLEKHWNDRLLGSNLYAEYHTRKVYKRDRNYTREHYFELPGSPARESLDSMVSSDVARRHEINVHGTYADETAGVFYGQVNASFVSDDAATLERTENELADGTVFRQLETGSDKNRDWSVGTHLRWTKTLNNKATLDAFFAANAGRSSGFTNVTDTLDTSTNKRNILWKGAGSNAGISGHVGVEGLLINTDVQSLRASIGFGVSSSNDRRSRDATSLYPRPGGPLDGGSYDLSYGQLSYGLSSSISFSRNGFNTGAIAHLSMVSLSPQGSQSKQYMTIDGQVSAAYKSWLLTLTAMSHVPDASQVADRIDDRNPVSLVAGNPALRPSTSFLGVLSYRNATLIRNGSISLTMNGNIDTAPIVSDIRYYSEAAVDADHGGYLIPAGAMLSTWCNAPLSWHIALSGTYMQRIQPLRMTLSVSPSYGFSRSSAMVGGSPVANYSSSFNSFNNRIMWTPYKWLKMSVTDSFSYTRTRGETAPAGQTLRNTLQATSKVDFLKIWSASASYSFGWSKTASVVDYSTSSHVLNASVGVKLLKGRLGISVSGTDLLGVNDSYSTTLNSVSLKESWKPSFGRYFLLHLSWTFNKTSQTKFSGALFDGHDIRQEREQVRPIQ